MDRMTERKIILVTRRTRLEDLITRFNTVAQAKFYVEHLGADFADYEREHAVYREAVKRAIAGLTPIGRVQNVDREFLPNFIFGPGDTVAVVGQDGLVANTLKYLDAQPVVAANPDPARWDGVLLPFDIGDLGKVVSEVVTTGRPFKEITMARADTSDGQSLHAVNDFFVGRRTHISARYEIITAGRSEHQSSSGVIVSTGLGASGWLKSVIAAAEGVAAYFGAGFHTGLTEQTGWDTDRLHFSVREPFPSRHSGAGIVFGEVTREAPLALISAMPEDGVIFSDGIESDRMEFLSGTRATITVADRKGRLVV